MSEKTRSTEKIFHFAHAIVGRMPGGLAQVNVVNSVIFSGMSGSAVADASGTGLVEIKAMANGGYPKDFACATTAATSTIGPIIPPSIPMVIYAYLSATSVGMLFAAGMLPGLLLAWMHMVLIYFLAKRRGYPREMWPGFGQTLGRFGVLLFIVSSTTGTPLQDVIRQIWPFLGIMIVSLMFLILFPDIVLFVPRLMGYGG